MRLFFGTCAPLFCAVLAFQGPALPFVADKGGKAKKPVTRLGVKRPGVAIPFENLKFEAEIPEPQMPGWLFFDRSLFVPGPDKILKLKPKTNEPEDPIGEIRKPCSGMVSAFDSLWVSSCEGGALVRVETKTGKIKATMPIGAPAVPGGIAASTDSVWVLTDGKTTLSRVDPDQNAVVGELRLPAGCRSLLFAEKSLWVACPEDNQVLRLNPATNLIEKSVTVSNMPQALAAGEGSVWAFCKKDGKIDRIDPKTNKVSKTIDLEVPGVDGSMAFGEGSLWVSQPGYPITRIDPGSETVMQQFYGVGGGVVLTSPGVLWLLDPVGGKLLHLDPKRVAATLAE